MKMKKKHKVIVLYILAVVCGITGAFHIQLGLGLLLTILFLIFMFREKIDINFDYHMVTASSFVALGRILTLIIIKYWGG